MTSPSAQQKESATKQKSPELIKPKKVSAKKLPPDSTKALEFPSSPTKDTKRNLSDPPTSPAKKTKKNDSDPSPVCDTSTPENWVYYQCQYKARGERCNNEAIWCERENSKKPKYCDDIKEHHLDTAQFNFYLLHGRKGFPKPKLAEALIESAVTKCSESGAEVDMQSAPDSDSDN